MYQPQSPQTRRNGKSAACEPCRTSKLRCDHARPVCGRCTARDIARQCFYHPSPMTRSANGTRGRLSSDFRVHKPSSPRPNDSSRASSLEIASFKPSGTPALELPSTSPGYLGSTSYSAVLAEHQKDIPADIEGGTESGSVMQTVDPERAQSGLRVLSLLYNLSLIDALIRKYYQSKWFMILPYVVVDSMLLSTRRIFDSFEPTETESRLRDLSIQIFRNSSRPLKPHRNMTIDDYTSSFTGENIRWETIGLMFALSGMSLLATHETDPAIAELQGSPEAKERLLNQISEATSTCIAFCDHAASPNEILAFAQHTDVMLRTQQYGDSSYQAWRRLGDLSATVYAAGLHQVDGPADDDCPFFLKQLRRGCFAAAFYIDKCVATFVGRPPLINYRYCTLTPPLDLSDDVLISGGEALDNAVAQLDAAGWDRQGRRHRTSLIRIRFLLAIYREEILELALGVGYQQDFPRKASKILERAQAAWETCPDHLRYDRCSDSNPTGWYDTGSPIFLLYLDYLYSGFLLHRTLIKYTGLGQVPLFDTARQLLSTVLRICNDRDNATDRSRHYSWIVLYYGLPSACVLAFEVLRQTQQAGPHPVVLPRAEVIRNLSVFVSCLSWVARPGQGNYGMCKEVEKKLSHILDRILDPPIAASEDINFVNDMASGLDNFLDWNNYNNWEFNSDVFGL
ncbi:hypothetical protein VTN96DRAFT_6605 [Rasamsonia emersonii]